VCGCMLSGCVLTGPSLRFLGRHLQTEFPDVTHDARRSLGFWLPSSPSRPRVSACRQRSRQLRSWGEGGPPPARRCTRGSKGGGRELTPVEPRGTHPFRQGPGSGPCTPATDRTGRPEGPASDREGPCGDVGPSQCGPRAGS